MGLNYPSLVRNVWGELWQTIAGPLAQRRVRILTTYLHLHIIYDLLPTYLLLLFFFILTSVRALGDPDRKVPPPANPLRTPMRLPCRSVDDDRPRKSKGDSPGPPPEP